ncbi:MAG: YebC/PmpR family DNA-binding transcriptional regulator [Halanaerobiales bacterium]|nr:YebC/PmpR family DNA-binding transcriptional regulator [Halanaerobiales bacterium]
MAGHSKWANIKHRKQKQDKKRGKLFSKLSRKIAVAAREGGGDPEMNADLAFAIDKAKDNDMPKDNIEKAIKRGTGELEGVDYKQFTYEGYGPGGVALYLDIMSDNRNRTASEIRHILSEHGGNLGEAGCVAWMFERKGQIIIDLNSTDLDEEEAMMEAIEAGADDIDTEDNVVTVYTKTKRFQDVKAGLKKKGFEFVESDLAMVPNTTIKLEKSDAKKMMNLMEDLEDHDDIQEVYSNFDIPADVMEQIEKEE